MERPRLILATRRPPYPLDNGARIRTHRLAQGLGRSFDVILVTYIGGPTRDDTLASIEDVRAALPGIEVVGVPFPGGGDRSPRRALLSRRSLDWGIYDQEPLRSELRRLSAGALLHLDDPGVALAGLGSPAAVTAFAPHNVEHRIVRDLARSLPPRGRAGLELEWRKVAREERRLWRGSDLCVAVSEVDAATMRAGGARDVLLVPNGADAVEPLPPPPPPGSGELRLLFVGSADFWPYELGLAWFVREALPALRVDGPVTLTVVGAPPTEPVPAEGVVYTGRVPEVRPYYEQAHALVIPIFQGSGTRLKAVEAAVVGRPIVSTALGVEGLPLRPREHYLPFETAEDLRAAVARLREEAGGRMAHAARKAVDGFLWPGITADLAGAYLAALENRPATRQMTSTR